MLIEISVNIFIQEWNLTKSGSLYTSNTKKAMFLQKGSTAENGEKREAAHVNAN